MKQLQEEIKRKERKVMIRDMVTNKLVIKMEEPVEVARRLRKSKRSPKLPSIERNEHNQSKMDKKKDDDIARDGIYIIKDKDTKKVSMPNYDRVYEIMKQNRIEKPDKTEATKPVKRHINIASTNPLASTEFKKKRKPKAQTKR